MERELTIKEAAVLPNYSAVRKELLSKLPVSERWLNLAGIPTAVLEGGEGKPVILLHGPGEFAATWMRVIPGLVATHRVIAPDLPGHGESGTGHKPLNANRIIDWLGELIDQTCSSPPVLAGHLLGGAIGLRFAARYSGRLQHLVLVDSFGLGKFRPSLKFAFAMFGFIAKPTSRTQDRLFRRCFVDYDGLQHEMKKDFELIKTYALERARTGELKTALRSLMPEFALKPVPPEDLRKIKTPVSMIWGRHDLQVRLQIAQSASANYAWPLHIIENAADDPAFEEPEAFIHAMRAPLDNA